MIHFFFLVLTSPWRKIQKNTERELKIQTTPKFFVKYKRREKKYKKQLLPRLGGAVRGGATAWRRNGLLDLARLSALRLGRAAARPRCGSAAHGAAALRRLCGAAALRRGAASTALSGFRCFTLLKKKTQAQLIQPQTSKPSAANQRPQQQSTWLLAGLKQRAVYEQRCALFYYTVRAPRGWDRILLGKKKTRLKRV